ncbi:unnamed protein product [Closterium sp. Yama58-4]|nr:unnamed protein product [Closterium sp. Yama58-4]
MAKRDRRASQTAKPQKKVKSPAEITADKLRYHRDLDSRWAIISENRVEYFRGKDFADLLRKHPELATPLIPAEDAASLRKPIEEAVFHALVEAQLVVRCDRVVKTLRPGRKKLSKWPARLEFHQDQAFTVDDGFYAWTYERQQPIWQTILSFLLPVFTVACCLFPVFPHWCKLAVLYFLLGLIALIFLLLFVRVVVFGVIWLAVGKRVWFFPSILAEEGSLAELFRFWPDKDDKPPAKITTRLAVAVMLGFTFWLMVTYAPDQEQRAKYQKKVSNIIDDVLQWQPQMLAGKITPASPVNATPANQTSANATADNSTTPSASAEAADVKSDSSSGASTGSSGSFDATTGKEDMSEQSPGGDQSGQAHTEGNTMADDEPVDPKPEIEEGCRPKCVKQLLAYEACVKRIEGDETGEKHCTGQYFDYWACIDKCAAPKIFSQLK